MLEISATNEKHGKTKNKNSKIVGKIVPQLVGWNSVGFARFGRCLGSAVEDPQLACNFFVEAN